MVWSPPMARSRPPPARSASRSGLNLGDGFLGAERRARDVAGIDHLGQLEGEGVECGVVGAQQA